MSDLDRLRDLKPKQDHEAEARAMAEAKVEEEIRQSARTGYVGALEAIKGGGKTAVAVNELNKAAEKDLSTLFTRVGLSMRRNIEWFELLSSSFLPIGDIVVVAHDLANKELAFSGKHVRVEDEKMLVGVVCYDNGSAKDAYLFPAKSFHKPGLLSIFARNKKTGECKVNMSNKDKLEKYSFGVAVEALKQK